jgi:hypothetical protein
MIGLAMTSSRSALTSVVAASAAIFSLLAPAPAQSQGKKAAAATSASAATEITFTGYQSLPNGGGILFVEMTKAVEVEVVRNGRQVEYRLVGARVPLRNNKNPLLLSDFDSSAASAQLVTDKAKRGKHGKREPGVRLVLKLRSDVVPVHRVVQRGKGAALEIELPKLEASSASTK